VRLQLDRGGQRSNYSVHAPVSSDELLADAPEMRVGATSVRLDGLRYRIDLGLFRETEGAVPETTGGSPDVTGTITLDATPGRSLPPLTVRGAKGWESGYVVPVLSGPLAGTLHVEGESVDLGGGTGYHDHNWGFWEGVRWQWGQVAGGGLSFVYGRIRPPAEAADPVRVPGFMMVLGPDGPVRFFMHVSIVEEDDPSSDAPRRVTVSARDGATSVDMSVEIEDAVVRTRLGAGGGGREFLQMRGTFRVTGRLGEREIDFTAPGAAETFRDVIP